MAESDFLGECSFEEIVFEDAVKLNEKVEVFMEGFLGASILKNFSDVEFEIKEDEIGKGCLKYQVKAKFEDFDYSVEGTENIEAFFVSLGSKVEAYPEGESEYEINKKIELTLDNSGSLVDFFRQGFSKECSKTIPRQDEKEAICPLFKAPAPGDSQVDFVETLFEGLKESFKTALNEEQREEFQPLKKDLLDLVDQVLIERRQDSVKVEVNLSQLQELIEKIDPDFKKALNFFLAGLSFENTLSFIVYEDSLKLQVGIKTKAPQLSVDASVGQFSRDTKEALKAFESHDLDSIKMEGQRQAELFDQSLIFIKQFQGFSMEKMDEYFRQELEALESESE